MPHQRENTARVAEEGMPELSSTCFSVRREQPIPLKGTALMMADWADELHRRSTLPEGEKGKISNATVKTYLRLCQRFFDFVDTKNKTKMSTAAIISEMPAPQLRSYFHCLEADAVGLHRRSASAQNYTKAKSVVLTQMVPFLVARGLMDQSALRVVEEVPAVPGSGWNLTPKTKIISTFLSESLAANEKNPLHASESTIRFRTTVLGRYADFVWENYVGAKVKCLVRSKKAKEALEKEIFQDLDERLKAFGQWYGDQLDLSKGKGDIAAELFLRRIFLDWAARRGSISRDQARYLADPTLLPIQLEWKRDQRGVLAETTVTNYQLIVRDFKNLIALRHFDLTEQEIDLDDEYRALRLRLSSSNANRRDKTVTDYICSKPKRCALDFAQWLDQQTDLSLPSVSQQLLAVSNFYDWAHSKGYGEWSGVDFRHAVQARLRRHRFKFMRE